MHYYQFNIGDYARDTSHLSLVEHGIYRLLLDWCYLNEKPITTEKALRVGRGFPTETQSVLSEFFVGSDAGWQHPRVNVEIEHFHKKAETNRLNGLKGGRPKPTNNPIGSQPQPNRNPNQEPITNNHKPTTKNQEPHKVKSICATATRLPADWKPGHELIEFCKTTRPELNPFDVADAFVDYWIAQPGAKGRKADWPATWRNWVRNQRKTASDGVKFLTPQQQRDENNRRSTAEFLADESSFFSHKSAIDGEFSNA
jgi:uncharacterized protein YdaU (DUF1376 family)